MRSLGLCAMNSMAISLAALIRSGVKSRASILVETSMARTMSMPSVFVFSISDEDLGRAMAMIIITIATIRSTNGMCRRTDNTDFPDAIHG